MKQNRLLTYILGVAVLFVAIVVVALSNKPEQKFDSNTPQGVVQAYVGAIFDGDYNTAASYFSPNGVCKIEDLDRAEFQEKPRIYLVETKIDNNEAQVKISVETSTGNLLDNSGNEYHTMRLENSSIGWKLTGIPWPLFDCGVIKK